MKIGPQAALFRSRLDEEHQKLFDWYNDSSQEDPMFWIGMVQAIACYTQDVTYWQAIAMAKEISEKPDFQKMRSSSLEKARDFLSRKIS